MEFATFASGVSYKDLGTHFVVLTDVLWLCGVLFLW